MRLEVLGIDLDGPVIGRALATILAVSLSSCSSANKHAGDFKPLPDRLTRGTMVGPLCDGDRCKCLESGGDPGLPDRDGVKRYQFHLGPVSNEMWVTLDDMVLYKGVERADECFIVDLRHGKHQVVMRARGDAGFASSMDIAEIGKLGTYETFEFNCGGSDPCTFDYLKNFKRLLAIYRRGIHDPCGSTRIRAVEWLTGGSIDRIHPDDLQVSFTLDIYDFAPQHESGHAACKDRY